MAKSPRMKGRQPNPGAISKGSYAYYDMMLDSPRVQQALKTIQALEGTADEEDPYAVGFGYDPITDFSDHPHKAHPYKNTTTSAAGAFQITGKTWDSLKKQLGLPSFRARNQQIAALALIDEKGALPNVFAGDLRGFIQKTGGLWASFPDSPIDQPHRSWGFAQRAWDAAGAALAPSPDRPDNHNYQGPFSKLPSRSVDVGSRRVASAFGDPIQSFTPRGIAVSSPVTPASGYARAMSFANDLSTTKADRLGPQTPLRDYGWTGGLNPGQRKSIQQQAYEANLATAGGIPGMLAAMDALGRPNDNAPIEDTRRQAIQEAREQARVTAYDRAKIPHAVTSTRFTPDLRPVDRAPAPLAPTISAPPARPDMRNMFPPAPPEPTQMNPFKAELGPALRQAFISGLVGGPAGAVIGLVGGLLGTRTGGLLGRLGPGFDAAIPSADRFSTGSGLGGIMSAMGGARGAQGFSRSNPGMSYTSLGPNMGGLRRSEKYGWTEHVDPSGSVTGISYDNGGGGLLGGLSRGLGSLFGGDDGGAKGKSKGRDGKGKKGGAAGGYSGNGLY